jgi:hypothetical protein
MNIRSRVDRLERVAGLEQQQSQSPGTLPWWHHIDVAQRRMLAVLSDEELRALHATVVAFQAGLELTPEQETLAPVGSAPAPRQIGGLCPASL